MSVDKLPEGWTRVKFGDVTSRVTESVRPTPEQSRLYIGLEHMRPDSYTITDWGSEVDLDVTKTPILRGDVLFARRNTHLRRCAVAPFDTIFSPDGYAIRTKDSSVLLQEFLLHVVASDGFMDYAVENSAGTHSKRVKWSSLERYEFPLPPLDEQQKIVKVLAQAESVVATSSRAVLVARTALIQLSIQLTRPTGVPSVPLERAAEVLDSRRIPVNDAERSKRVGSVPYYGANGQVGVIDAAIFNEPLVLVPEDGGRFSDWRSNPVAYRIDGPSRLNNHAHVLKARGIPHGWLYFSLRNLDMTHLVVGTTRTKLNRSSLTKIEIGVPADRAGRLEWLEGVDAVRAVAEQHLEDAKRIFSVLRNKLVSLGGHDHVQ